MRDDTKQALELLVEKAHKLRDFKFDEHVRQIGLSFRGKRTENDEWIIEFDIPDEKERDAFILTLRLFIQENESISFPNLNWLLSDNGLSVEFREGIKVIRQAYFDYLNGHSAYSAELFEGRPTRAQMFDAVLYGGLAHANRPEKLQRFRDWSRDGIRTNVLQQEFTVIVLQILAFINRVADLCEKELNLKPA